LSAILPERLGKYRITEVIGRGAMGVVYKGIDPVIERPVAIKTIRRELVEEGDAGAALARFKTEARAAGRLSHPGIVGVYEYGEDADLAFLAMEYVQGNSLREYFNRGTRFELADTVSLMTQLLDALAYAHVERVWHRDIKPANLILMSSGRLRVADFGIARIDSSHLTQTGMVMGTPGYMAPEQYTGMPADWRADVFAAGVVFYQLLTGTRPFNGTPESIAYRVCHENEVPPSQVDAARVPPAFDAITNRALAKRPDERFQSAQAFLDALRAAYAAPVPPVVSEETIINETIRSPAPPDASHQSLGGSTGSRAPGSSGIPLPGWDAAILEQVQAQLTRLVGPLARVLVRRAAATTLDVDRLYEQLAANISADADRDAFLAGRRTLKGVAAPTPPAGTAARRAGTAPPTASTGGTSPGTLPPSPALTPEAIEAATARLARYLGPMARVMAKKAAARSATVRDFHLALAESLDEQDRAQFLKDGGVA